MTHEWTAAEVWELVKDWPDEARPDVELHWYTVEGKEMPGYYEGESGDLSPSEVAALHVASGLEWLTRHQASGMSFSPMVTFMSSLHDEEWGIDCGHRRPHNGPTLLHVLSAAIKAVGS